MTMEGYVGEIRLFAGNFAPRDWAFCDGSLLAIAEFKCLFDMIGAVYGGDGQTTFALPDLRARAVVGAGQGVGLTAYAIGQAAGTEQVPTEPVRVVSGTDADLALVSPVSDSNVQPALGLNFIICVNGIFPIQRS
jgi:microcystin-dependent protein